MACHPSACSMVSLVARRLAESAQFYRRGFPLPSVSHFHPHFVLFEINLNDLGWSSEMARWKALARGLSTGHLRRSSEFVEFGCEARESGIFWGWKWVHSENENKPATDAPNGAYIAQPAQERQKVAFRVERYRRGHPWRREKPRASWTPFGYGSGKPRLYTFV